MSPCPRCEGYCIEETFIDHGGFGSPGFSITGWRCVMCGCRGEGRSGYGSIVGNLAEGRRQYGAVHQYRRDDRTKE